MSRDLRRFMLEGGHRGEIAMIKSKHKERNKRNGNRLTEDKRQPGEGLRGGGEGGDGVRHRSMATAQSRGEANGPVVTTRGARWVLGQPGAGGGGLTNDVNI